MENESRKVIREISNNKFGRKSTVYNGDVYNVMGLAKEEGEKLDKILEKSEGFRVVFQKTVETFADKIDALEKSDAEKEKAEKELYKALGDRVKDLLFEFSKMSDFVKKIDDRSETIDEKIKTLFEMYVGERYRYLDDKLAAAWELVSSGKFEAAQNKYMEVYTSKNATDEVKAEAYFGAALSECKIQPIYDPTAQRYLPICFSTYELDGNENYKKISNLKIEDCQKNNYETFARFVKDSNKSQKTYNGQEYNCFICVKITDGSGKKTDDAVFAEKLYNEFISEDKKNRDGSVLYKPFFSEKTIKEGIEPGSAEYAGLIQYGLMKAKCLILICNDNRYITTPWVKNEYTRFLALNGDDKGKIICVSSAGQAIPGFEKNQVFGDNDEGIDDLKKIVKRTINYGYGIVEEKYLYCPQCGMRYPFGHGICSKDRIDLVNAVTFSALELKKEREEREKERLALEKEREEREKERLAWEKEKEELYKNLSKQAIEKDFMQKADVINPTEEGDSDGQKDVSLKNTPNKPISKKRIDSLESESDDSKEYTVIENTGLEYLYDKKRGGYEVSVQQDVKQDVKGDVVIPAFYRGKPVVTIGESAFLNCSGLTSVTIPDSVTSIGDFAFFNCSGLTSVTIGNGVTSIGSWAFEYCTGLTSITIPDSVTSIGDYAFCECNGLTSITIPDSMTSIGNGAFSGCRGLTSITYRGTEEQWNAIDKGFNWDTGTENYTLYFIDETIDDPEERTEELTFTLKKDDTYEVTGYKGIATELVIPTTYAGKAVTSIGRDAFRNCGSLTSITIPNSVTSIGNGAFSGCSGLTSITIPDSVTSIGSEAFYGCKGLTSVTIGNSVTSIEKDVFYGCSGLTKVYYTGDIASWSGISFGNLTANPFYYAHNLYINNELVTEITIPNTIKKINDYAFSGCSGLTSITIPNSLTSIGDYAFSDCSGLTSVTIPDSVTSIGMVAFYGCEGLTSISIPDSVTSIGNYAFSDCSGLTSINIPDSVTSIGDYAFFNCSGLTSIAIPDSVTSIGDLAFYNCTGLTNITYQGAEEQWNAIDKGFNWDTGTEKYTLYFIEETIDDPEERTEGLTFTLKKDDTYEVTGYKGIVTELVIPTTYAGKAVTSIGRDAFRNCSSLTSITIPNSVTSIGNYAFSDCSGLTSITIPDSLTSIGSFAFWYCCKLVEVYNKSSLNITKGNSDYGYIGYYAKDIYTEPYTSKLSTDSNGYILYTDGDVVSLIGYTGTDTELTLPQGITEINQFAFANCSGLTSIAIPDSVTSIGYEAFANCSGLTNITIPDSVTSMGNYAFRDCDGLTSIIIPDSVTSIGDYAFSFCRGLTSITIPDSVTSIGDYAFDCCSGLTSVTIGNSVTSIGNGAFTGCRNLTSITIPDSVTSIEWNAFCGCSGLTSITFTGTKAQWRKISKERYWNYKTGAYIVHCTDGSKKKYSLW